MNTDFYADYNGPMLDKVKVNFSKETNFNEYPFSLDVIKNLKDIELPTQVTFFVGENGAGKSTLLESIACEADFGPEGGSKNIKFKTAKEDVYSGVQNLSDHLTLSWRRKPRDGYFFRAESFFNIASFLDVMAKENGGPEMAYGSYGGKSLHDQSHGESFFSFFKYRVGSGFFIFDEPEAALSPQRQLSLLAIINEQCKLHNSQFIIATHSPILLAYPNATIYSFDSNVLQKIEYTETAHYQITKGFLDSPQSYFRHLLQD